jgi:hypothetical protein
VRIVAWAEPADAIEVQTRTGVHRRDAMWIEYLDGALRGTTAKVTRMQSYFRRDQDA